MQESKDPLHALIKSLTQNEKRYIKVFRVHGSENTDYLRLFDILDEIKVYDDKKFKKDYAKTEFVINLPQKKQYLKKKILAIMRVYHEDKAEERIIFALISDFHFLYGKGLYKEAQKLLVKAGKKAKARGVDWMELEINRLESKFEIEQNDKEKDLRKNIRPLQERQKRLLDRIQMEYLFTNSYHQVFIESRSGDVMEVGNQLADMLNSNQLATVLGNREEYSFNARLYFLNLEALAARIKGDKKTCQESYRQIVDLFIIEGRDKGEDLSRYIKAVSNYLTSCHEASEYGEFPRWISEFSSLLKGKVGGDERAEIQQNLYLIETLLYMNIGDWEKAATIPPKVRRLLLVYGNKVNKTREVRLSYNCMIIWLFHGSLSKMKPWINHILENRKHGFGNEAIGAAIILEIIYFIERQEPELVLYLKKAASRRDFKHTSKGKVLGLLGRINNSALPDRPALLKKLADLLHGLVVNRKPGEIVAGYAEIYYWARAREHGISIIDACKKYLLKENL